MTKWLTGRKVFTLLSLASSTFLQFEGRLGAESYSLIVIALAAGHHLPEVLRAWRGTNGGGAP